MENDIVLRGGADTERLYLRDADFTLPDGMRIVVTRTDVPTARAGMADVIARHRGRYGLVTLYCRPGYRVLDAACGSGYAADLLRPQGITYEGIDRDAPTIEYARRLHVGDRTTFRVADLRQPAFGHRTYEVIACLEGLEHLPRAAQPALVAAAHDALTPGGVFVVSSPEAVSGVSGPASHNPDHLWELTGPDFRQLLASCFGSENVEIITQRNIMLSTGIATTCLYAACHCQ